MIFLATGFLYIYWRHVPVEDAGDDIPDAWYGDHRRPGDDW
jgi:hypothetical protein